MDIGCRQQIGGRNIRWRIPRVLYCIISVAVAVMSGFRATQNAVCKRSTHLRTALRRNALSKQLECATSHTGLLDASRAGTTASLSSTTGCVCVCVCVYYIGLLRARAIHNFLRKRKIKWRRTHYSGQMRSGTMETGNGNSVIIKIRLVI